MTQKGPAPPNKAGAAHFVARLVRDTCLSLKGVHWHHQQASLVGSGGPGCRALGYACLSLEEFIGIINKPRLLAAEVPGAERWGAIVALVNGEGRTPPTRQNL
eukprot:CAMPEP_0174328670 /NCGR_PEP_ID=MMETSP0810-20121108/15287_1 /TAXON_ID=73025 ORGANISM="Eutreptiella gymnastica-like, Strain CCMP1594" /NCGR_SAMPLE_ID=MMETSP0810 /ASSEMBLY_ACC=CAM_ASM_000659 /LENGTH=102 /DNA_ID=CAMNT_0015442825 /DNA_START=360 /DNA_END=666 /DNA_ORIENTATION=-